MPIKIKKMSVMKPEDVEVKQLYNRFARFPAFLYRRVLGRATENSIYRKKAIASPADYQLNGSGRRLRRRFQFQDHRELPEEQR